MQVCEGEFVQVCMHRDIVLTLCSVLRVQRLLVCVGITGIKGKSEKSCTNALVALVHLVSDCQRRS